MIRSWPSALLLATLLGFDGGCARCTALGGCGASGARTSCPDGMVFIPGGTFEMGAAPGEAESTTESPAHRVTLSAYCIDRTEVTAAAYARCDERACAEPNPEVGPRCVRAARNPDHPRNCVTWVQARVYCATRGARLPTEAEWEFAAGGPEELLYPWGNEPPDASRARYGGTDRSGYPGTAPVGSHPGGRSPFGVLDMAGNVNEWTEDVFADYSAEPQTDPTGPSEIGGWRAIRGGAFDANLPVLLRTVGRSSANPNVRNPYSIGIRCAAAPE